ncbi:MAG: VPLPA-CTERM sorting domain-containing protein [Paracoccaceae bacterium]|nr:VPLPA-CTERM sorting domain-containing protein [Paracoccaceae bacterium]
MYKSLTTAGILLLGASGMTEAATVYTDRAIFEAAITVDLTEDFETLGTTTAGFSGPIVLPSGITAQSNSNELFVVAPNQSTNPTTAIGSNFPITDSLDFLLGGLFGAFGVDLFQNDRGGTQTGAGWQFDITLLNAGAIVGVFTSIVAPNGGSFFGVTSDSLFDSVSIFAASPGLFEVADNVTLGNSVASVPLPAGLPLILSALAGLGFVGRRRGRSA